MMSTVKDFNTFNNYRWLRPPMINCIGRLIEVCGLVVVNKRKVNFVQEFFYGYEPIAFFDDKVVHWNQDFSKCFTFVDGKKQQVNFN